MMFSRREVSIGIQQLWVNMLLASIAPAADGK